MRMQTNPELRKLLQTNPDIFAYGEAETPSSQNLQLEGYICYLHKSKLEKPENYRRGIAIFYLIKYRFHVTKVYASTKYDIVWMRLKTDIESVYFCFFYAPGSHHPLPVRTGFYGDFFFGFSKFSHLGKVYMCGDTNARLGSILHDRDVQGHFKTNPNKILLLEFLEYSGLDILNKKYCKGASTYEIVNRKRSIIDLCLTNATESVLNFRIEPKSFGVTCQTCHKALTTTISLRLSERVHPNIPCRTSFGKITPAKRNLFTLEVTNRITEINSKGSSYSYSLLAKIIDNAKRSILGIRKGKRKAAPHVSAAMRDLQARYSIAIENMNKDRSEFSYFVAGNLEKLIDMQYKHEKDGRFSTWLRKLNDLDFQNRTRAFFTEIRSRQKLREEPVPILDTNGTLSDNLKETLDNWSEYYKNLYSGESLPIEPTSFPTPGEHEYLDKELSHIEFVDVIYSLKNYKSPGYDQILNEDIKAAVMEETSEDLTSPEQKIILLRFIFNILSDFWFNENVPRDLKRTVLRPFLKDNDKSRNDPSNYRPISLLNTLMKIYEGIICNRIVTFLEKNHFFSPYQAAYRKGRSTADQILVLHELFLEYRYNSFGPRGGQIRKPLYFCFLDLKKAFDTVPRRILFKKLFNAGIRGKMLRVIQNLFSANPANVLIDNFLSPEFVINRGVLQGSKLGPILFNVFINDLLNELEESRLGAYIGPIHIPALGFADDIALITEHPHKLQELIDRSQSWAIKNKMSFNTPKCKVMKLIAPQRLLLLP